MHMNVHSAVGIIMSLLLSVYLSEFQILLFIGVSIIIDFDFLFSKYAKNHNHRRLITHTYIPYIISILIGLILLLLNLTEFWMYFFLIGVAGVFHVSLDLVDWGIMLLFPFKREIKGGFLSISEDFRGKNDRIPHCYFIIAYYKSKIIRFLEISIASLALLMILIVDINFIYIMLVYVGLLLLHVYQYLKCVKKNPALD
ncbi:MAG: metal-dependent hydrolase [Candidatus Helarchaeota archaeon]